MPTEAAAEAVTATAGSETVSDVGQGEAWIHNVKRLVEEFMALGLENARASQALAQRVSNNAITADEDLRRLSILALTNAINQSNLINTQAVAHRDLSITKQLSTDEVIETAVMADMVKRAASTTDLNDIVKAAVADALAKAGTTP